MWSAKKSVGGEIQKIRGPACRALSYISSSVDWSENVEQANIYVLKFVFPQKSEKFLLINDDPQVHLLIYDIFVPLIIA